MRRIKKILARAHGGKTTGMGHVYRLLGLNEMFSGRTKIHFLKSPDTPENVFSEKISWSNVPEESINQLAEAQWIAHQFSPEEHLMILDGYDYDAAYQNVLKDAGFDIVYLDDQLKPNLPSNIILNASLGIRKEDYQTGTTTFGLGPQYAALRPEFLAASRSINEANTGTIESVVVCFGGADPHQLAKKTVHQLIKHDQLSRIVVISSLFSEVAFEDKRVEVVSSLNAEQMVEIISSVAAAITSASTISYEMCSLRKPLLVGWYVDNQENLYNGLIENGLCAGMGNMIQSEDDELGQKIGAFLKEDHQNQIERQKEVFDGLNQVRLRKLIYPLLTPITLREATPEDVDRVYEWASDPDVRAQSLNSDPIPYENHVAWYENRLKKAGAYYYIAEVEGKAVGQIRIDPSEGSMLISYLVAKEARGNGFGLQLVSMAMDEVWTQQAGAKFIAHVKADNKASLSVFQKLGFSVTESSAASEVRIFVLS